MLDKLAFIEDKYRELTEKAMDPNLINEDREEWQRVMKEQSDLEPIVSKYREYTKAKSELEDSKEMLYDKALDEDMRDMVKEEVKALEESLQTYEDELKLLLLPKDPNDHKNVIVEIRGGAGGDEAALFAGVLFRMYVRYAERNNWKVEIMNTNEIGIGGYKEVIFMIKGKGAYSKLKYESGVHRVQRVPETEASGRIHTSTATVAVLPEAEDVDVEINPQDIRVDVFRSSGNGGQSVNTTDSAVRITHNPTGIVVSCQDEKSQLKNKEKALKILKTKLYDMKIHEQNAEMAQLKKGQVGTGDRSERIRTYNFPQGRVTDHRINLTLYKLNSFVDGDLEEMIDSLTTTDQAERLQQIS
ncbi:MAG TPA: peptide chain release factor 1 [Tissierellales bacterium]|uniref:peptide chain release factor 1 n=1 Tax=Gudongella oleilytica TaxID=1582259 RepID=UPI000ED132AD|nr:peptide chain release factor 1 [Gudongella oleilytica]MDY0257901.1 peptide chain release factor 1 [Gudongella oleilytica]HCO18827.1 peptide chain release factor 1 [Tissierellales bacterium]